MKKLFFLFLLVMVTSCGSKKEDATEAIDSKTLDSMPDQKKIQDTLTVQPTDTLKNGTVEAISNTNDNNQNDKVTTEAEITKNKTAEVGEKEEVADVDHSLWNTLLKKNVSSSGKVNYKGFTNDRLQLETYLEKLSYKIPDASWSKNAKLAYWINVYNAYTVKLIIDNYPLKSIKNIANPWEKKFIVLEHTNYSLEQVENDILRKMNEPTIHFAINCASYSCPDLYHAAYVSSSLERQLTLVTKRFINDTSKNSLSENEIKVSEIFNWFSNDFKTKSGSVIAFINKYTTVIINEESKVSFMEYNLNLNE